MRMHVVLYITFIFRVNRAYSCREEECAEAYKLFNGRWYAQKQLSCEFCPVQKWKTAICGELLPVVASTNSVSVPMQRGYTVDHCLSAMASLSSSVIKSKNVWKF